MIDKMVILVDHGRTPYALTSPFWVAQLCWAAHTSPGSFFGIFRMQIHR
jgi:hypothetical protein